MLDLAKQGSNPKLLSPLTLAFMGDVVYELMVREQVISAGSMPPNKLHKKTVEMVKASFQARVYDLIADTLPEDEADILRRGRNSSGVHAPKNADVLEYRKATGVEALFGYLYLGGKLSRINELFERILTSLAS
ncbi:ribonuclease III domain-containing protein [Hydrogenoanaerobacterium sp.]|uniref:Mini-ribonuclease 3 n=1 Tax=Hydrogenoanaerobacterium sp. TaxID=2953763 RepID=UPI0028A1FAE5|nr:ribonuclease III domain-containing protein [Hydrogenoanaerobacterium sp.]